MPTRRRAGWLRTVLRFLPHQKHSARGLRRERSAPFLLALRTSRFSVSIDSRRYVDGTNPGFLVILLGA